MLISPVPFSTVPYHTEDLIGTPYRTRVLVRDIFCGVKRALIYKHTDIIVIYFRINIIALTHTATLQMILRTWGARITSTAQREHAGQILRGMQAIHDCVAFTRGWGG